MATAFFNIIILIGAIQGFILSFVLYFFSNRNLANKLLSQLLFLTALASFSLFAYTQDWFGISILQTMALILPHYFIMPLGPLIYFYVRAYSVQGFTISSKQRQHFIPLLFDLLPSLIAIVFICGVFLGVFKNNPGPIGNLIDTYNTYVDIPRWLSISIYLWISSRYLNGLSADIDIDSPSFKWLQNIIRTFLIFQVIWLIYLIPYVLPAYNEWMLSSFSWYPVYLPLSILIYYLSLKGFIMGQKEYNLQKKAKKIYSSMSADELSVLEKQLKEVMEKELAYLDPKLNVNHLAILTSSSPKMVSAVLNNHMSIGFNDFVNSYRIQAFKKSLLSEESEKYSITGIAYSCGFNSHATFQRAFKQATGLSPSEYKNRNK